MADRFDRQVGNPDVRGRCPACGHDSLFLGSNGYVTCGWIGCSAPGAATDWLGKQREDIAALLRFRDAMTPEMWEALQSVLCQSAKRLDYMLDGEESMDAFHCALAALDTLRTALQREPEHHA